MAKTKAIILSLWRISSLGVSLFDYGEVTFSGKAESGSSYPYHPIPELSSPHVSAKQKQNGLTHKDDSPFLMEKHMYRCTMRLTDYSLSRTRRILHPE